MRDRIFPRRFLADERGAVATTYALALVGLVVAAGVGYDYAQVATLDTELQNAADQAALAGATQLDGKTNAIARAKTAAQTYVANTALMANDGGTSAVTIDSASYAFYDTKAHAETDTGAVTDDASAKFVKVSIVSRKAHYTLTPIISRIVQSGSINASATAGLGSSICKVPPVMMCNPAEDTDKDFTTSYVGRGFRLVAVGGNSFAPGNFGYIETNPGNGSPITELKQALGWTSPPGTCLDTDSLTTKPGANTPVTDALNTRFDIYDNNACPSGGSCPPSINTTKDLIKDSNASSCGTTGQGWSVPNPEYLPDPTTRLPASTPQNMGLPRDICHAVSSNGDCPSGVIGDGNWDRTTYFSVNYPGFNWQAAMNTAYGTTAVTRYQVYRWEIAHSGDSYGTSTIGAARAISNNGKGKGNGNTSFAYHAPTCQPPGVNPLSDTTDRRTFPVAVVNCKAANINGRTTGVPIKKWVNVFLVEPSLQRTRTQQTDVYVEIVSVNTIGAGSEAGAEQVVRRDKPYLVK